MTAVALGVAAALVALRCQLISDDPYVLGSVSRVLPGTRPAFLDALNATRRLIGCPVDEDVLEPDPPFLGGQCDCAVYQVTVDTQYVFTNPTTGNTVTVNAGFSQRARGPVRGISVRRSEGSPERIAYDIDCRGLGEGGNTPPCGPQGIRTAVPGNANLTNSSDPVITGQTVTPLGGQPNDCGDPPLVYPPPTNFNTDIDITYNIDDGTEVTVNAPFVFSPITANFDGSLRIPLSFNLGGVEFSGNLNLPDFNLTINPPGVGQGGGEDLTGEGEDGPGETVPPAPPGEKIIGVVVNATQIDSRRVSSYSSPGITDIFVPRLGSIKFAYSIGIATFFSSDIDIKDRRTFIPCPFSQGADSVIASPNLGVDLTFTPIRGFPLATTNDIVQT